jgi:uncharacterized protein (UPF0276 family)
MQTKSYQSFRDGPAVLGALPKLGVGILYSEALDGFIESCPESFDFLEIIPDTFLIDNPKSSEPEYHANQSALLKLDLLANRGVPIILHSTGLSIGSHADFDRSHLVRIHSWWERYRSFWHSDHLATFRVRDSAGTMIDVGFPMSIPYDRDSLAYVAERIHEMQQTVPIPFLLENNVYYFETPEQELSEPEFLNSLCAMTGAGILLDLHNLYTNARNHDVDEIKYLDALDLDYVVEIHIAGGHQFEDVWLDSHSDVCPARVWKMLTYVLSRAPNVAGIVFEIFPTWFSKLGVEGLQSELNRARAIWCNAGNEELTCL